MIINPKLYAKVKTAKFSFSIIPSGGSTTVGIGSTSVDISSLNAEEILGVTFTNGFNYLVCGTDTDLTSNPTTLNVYGYRLGGKMTSAVAGSVIVMYTK